MKNRICFSLFILCCILSQGITFLSDENNDKSANLHVRKKRIIDITPEGNQPVPLQRVPYVVSVIKNNKHQCGGSILSSNIIVTAAHCVMMAGQYHIFSGSEYENQGTPHIITGAHFYPGYNPARSTEHDFCLLTIYPFINFEQSPNRPIKLLNREISLDTVGTVSGWGSNVFPPNHRLPGSLRSITLPLVGKIICQQYYNEKLVVDSKKFCTFDLCDQKACGPGDSGNPFVVDGRLAGVQCLIGKNIRAPEVYVNLCDYEYREWIHRQIARFQPNEHAIHIPLIMNGRIHQNN